MSTGNIFGIKTDYFCLSKLCSCVCNADIVLKSLVFDQQMCYLTIEMWGKETDRARETHTQGPNPLSADLPIELGAFMECGRQLQLQH